MAAGLPIVATAVGGVPEIVTTEKEAILVEKQSPNGLAFAIDRFLKDADLRRRISEGARKAARSFVVPCYRSIAPTWRVMPATTKTTMTKIASEDNFHENLTIVFGFYFRGIGTDPDDFAAESSGERRWYTDL